MQKLYLFSNQLRYLPPEIGQLSHLQDLRLYSNQLNSLPPEIGQLSHLQVFDISINQLSCLPPEIGQLSHLQELDLSENLLKSLPSKIGQLGHLRFLDLSDNQLSKLLPEIELLKQLVVLDIRQNPCTLFESLAKLKRQGGGIYVPKNCYNSPEEILKKAAWEIYYFLKRDEDELLPLNEAKLIIVGDALVGKTCLVNRLIRNTYEDHPKTEGIDIHQWKQLINEQEIRLNVWDFGGQEVLHAPPINFFSPSVVFIY